MNYRYGFLNGVLAHKNYVAVCGQAGGQASGEDCLLLHGKSAPSLQVDL
jgi:hypothetical protein